MMQNNPKRKNVKIAVTGGIGSGKSTVLAIVKKLGYKTISFDDVYRELLGRSDFVSDICELTGIPPICVDGRLQVDRRAIADKVFSDKTALSKLNEFTHPAIASEAFLQGGDGIVFYEVPLLFESGMSDLFDKVIVVKKALPERLKSAATRDGVSVSDIEKKAKNQINYEKIDLSLHIVIENDGDMESLENKVRKTVNALF